MRVILTVNYSPWSRYSGGGQRSTHNLARALVRRGHHVTVVFSKPPWERVQLPKDLRYEAVFATLPGARRGSPLFVAQQVQRLLRAAPHGSIVHSNGEEGALIPELRRAHPPGHFGFVMTPRYPALPDVLLKEPAQRSELRLLLLALLRTKYVLLGRALRGASWVCPTSTSAADMVQRAYSLPRERMTVVPNGISDEFLRLGDTSSAPPALRADLQELVGEQGFAVFFGRIAPEKGVRVLLEALSRAGNEQPARFVFAGRGPDVQRVQAGVKQLGLAERVRFAPWLDAADLAALVRRASFAVLPSLEESFGNSIAEAMILSVPVISTTAGSIPELIEHGKHGWLVAPNDPDALAAAMRMLAADPERQRELGAAGRARVIERFTWDASAAAFERVYQHVIENKL